MKNTEIYQHALSSISEAVMFTDPTQSENPIVQVNPAFVELTGYPEEEAVGRPWHFLCGTQTSKRAQNDIQRALDNAESITTKILNYRNDGSSFWNELTMDPVYDNNSELLCFTGMMRDITETKRRQHKLEESSRRFLELLGKNEDIVWMFNRDWSELHYINGAYEEISGRPLHHLYYDPLDFLEAIHPDDRARVKSAIETLIGGEPVDLEYRANKKEDFGRWVWVKGYPLFDEQGEPHRVAGFARDITERKQREQELQKSQNRMNLALESARAGMWEFVPETGEEYWDENLYRLYGLDPQSGEASFETFLELVHPEDREQLVKQDAKSKASSESFTHEYRIQRDGETRWIQAKGQITRSPDESFLVLTGISLDITEQKRLQHELEEAVEERDTLIQEVHHRVKNNLQIIISLIKMQLREMEVSETVASSFKDLENRIYTTALIHEQVYRKASLANINVRDYLRELAEHVIRSQSYSGEVELDTDLEPIDLSIEKLLPCGLVTNELLTNALQHGFEDRNEGRVELQFHRLDDSGYELILADDGVGWKADSSFEEVQSLGMTLVKNLVRKQLHGTIELKEQEKGVGYRIVIPVEEL